MGLYAWITSAGAVAGKIIPHRGTTNEAFSSTPEILPPVSERKLTATAIAAIDAELKKAKEALRAKIQEMPANEYGVATSFCVALSDANFPTKAGFDRKPSRVIIREFIQEWNKTHQKGGVHYLKKRNTPGLIPIEITDYILDQFEALFATAIKTIKNGGTIQDPENPLLTLLKQHDFVTGNLQEAFIFQMNYQDKTDFAVNFIHIDQHDNNLNNLYSTAIQNFQNFKEKPDEFVKAAQGYLQEYYKELLKLNADASNPRQNHWTNPAVKLALSFYFDQRELLYRIYSATRPHPESVHDLRNKISLMGQYKEYIMSTLARPNEYKHEYSFNLGSKKISLHPDESRSRSIKILAAFDQYYTWSDLPGDVIPPRSPWIQEAINHAGENGQLGELKKQGLNYLGHGPVKDAFSPLGIFGDIEAKPIKRNNASFNN